ncbi:MAG TPA: DUF4965 domain-containing protein [Bryobacteraceae bacterium]|nr:DUF4965 domain-containing protein [Bryobacteraceae bacterium]
MNNFTKRLLPAWLLVLSPGTFAADFRPPAVPLVTHDPYFSIWSMADHLTDQPTKHWTGTVQLLSSLVRVDGKVYRIMGTEPRHSPALQQTRLEVLPTHTIYDFEGAGVRLTLTFFTPALTRDLDVLSRPATYLTWSIQSTDSGTHSAQLYFDAGSDLVVDIPQERVSWARYRDGDLQILRMGTQQQPVLEKSGDNLRIDWGYLYVVTPPGSGGSEIANTRREAMGSFIKKGSLPDSDELRPMEPYEESMPVLAASFDLGAVGATAVSRYLVIAYDDVFAIEYFERKLRPYWNRDRLGPAGMLRTALRDYHELDQLGTNFDQGLMADLRHVGGEDYARLCALAYSQTLSAHKLTADLDGAPLFFSKENFSNGSVDTVDVTYPSSPFFLLFNPHLLEAQLKPIFDYASLPRWRFPFAPHDLGRYPLADGQQYGGRESSEEDQMPVEESGNMLLMTAGIAQVEGNAEFAQRYWPVLTKWAEYLKAKGFDPENQLSTDDFAGHLAHNANLSIKAILALGAYGKLAGMLGHGDIASEYTALARKDAALWVQKDNDGDHFRLAFDRPGTWSQKYNLVWDKLLGLNLFAPDIAEKALAFYEKHLNRYGLPLDNRADYTKLDWLTWTASLARSQEQFQLFFEPAYRFANESPSRVPLTDWYDTKTGKQVGFQARSVVGGIFIKMLSDPEIWKKYAGAALRQ